MSKLTKQQQTEADWQLLTEPGPFAFCPVRSTLNVLGGKWKLLILSSLFHNARRYGELRRQLPEITEKMLIQQLRELELDGIVERTVYQQIPPKVEYTLTELGRRVQPVMTALVGWGQEYLERDGGPTHPADEHASVAAVAGSTPAL